MKIITWNINSVRLRIDHVTRLLGEEKPDILCLQETKCPDDKFPHEAFDEAGYTHRAIRGEKSYNGLAIIAKQPLHQQRHLNWDGKTDCRHLAVTLGDGTDIHNFYVPAGGDVPDAAVNDKFKHKMNFLAEMKDWAQEQVAGQKNAKAILVGDLNIAPREDDVWSHKNLLKIVSHTPWEVEALNAVMGAGNWHDGVRHHIPEGQLYSWWSYRAKDWSAADKGRRLDHIWVTENLIDKVKCAEVIRNARGWEQPSDHAPVALMVD